MLLFEDAILMMSVMATFMIEQGAAVQWKTRRTSAMEVQLRC
jgi:hypothetical protein